MDELDVWMRMDVDEDGRMDGEWTGMDGVWTGSGLRTVIPSSVSFLN